MRRLPVVLHVVYKNDWSSTFLPGCACVHLPTMIPRVKPPLTLVSVLHWLWYCRATALSALANITLLLGKNTLPFPAFGNLNFLSPPHRRAYASMPKSCTNITFTHQQDFFEKIRIFVHDFVPIRIALRGGDSFLFIYFIFLPVVLVFLYSMFCLCPNFRVWSDGLYFLFGVFLP